MKINSIEWSALCLVFVSFSAIVIYLNASRAILIGGVYLAAASFIGTFSLFKLFHLKARMKRTSKSQLMGLLQTRAQVLMLVAWQLAIIGLLNIWSINTSRRLGILLLSNCLFALCVFTWDRLISVADSPSQDGGAKPLISRGRPRSRRFAFWVFFVYPLSSFVLAGVLIFMQGIHSLAIFRPPQISLLVDAAFSVGAAGFIFQRYRCASRNLAQRAAFFSVWLLIICAAMGFRLFVGWDLYVNLLSATILTSSALSSYYLWSTENPSLPQTA